MTAHRLFSPPELAVLARTPTQQVRAACDTGEPAAIADAMDAVERRFRAGIRGFAAWEAGTLAALARLPAADGALGSLVAERAWLVATLNDVTADDLAVTSHRRSAEIAAIAERDGPAAAFTAYTSLESSYRRLHDAHRDAVSALWTTLHDLGGPPALEACLRELAERSLMRWMERDLNLPPTERLREWTAVMTANFSVIRIEEHDDRFTITQDPCGSCTRQIAAGRLDPPLSLATVAPFAPDQLGPAAVPVYRSHVGLMHWLMPLERSGAPWPIVRCPTGAGTGPCQLEITKEATRADRGPHPA